MSGHPRPRKAPRLRQGYTGRRTTPLPTDWYRRRRPAILRRDANRCTWIDGQPDGGWPVPPTSAGIARTHAHPDRCQVTTQLEVDHVGDDDNHEADWLRTLCRRHHQVRTSEQARAAASAARRSRGRPQTAHPGVIA